MFKIVIAAPFQYVFRVIRGALRGMSGGPQLPLQINLNAAAQLHQTGLSLHCGSVEQTNS
jgi:hypothetical protein